MYMIREMPVPSVKMCNIEWGIAIKSKNIIMQDIMDIFWKIKEERELIHIKEITKDS